MACWHSPSGLAAVLALVNALAGAQAAAPLRLYTEDYPPFNWQDRASGKATGLSADIVLELIQRAGMTASASVFVPWARGMAQTAATPNTCLYSTTRTPERETLFSWVGPIGRNEWVMFARRDARLSLHGLADARKFQVGTVIGDAIIPFLVRNQIKPSVTGSHRLNLQKLRAQRIGLWATGRLPGWYALHEAKIDDIEPVLSITQSDLYLACHPAMAKDDIDRLNEALRSMHRDGTILRLYSFYGYEKDAPRPDPTMR